MRRFMNKLSLTLLSATIAISVVGCSSGGSDDNGTGPTAGITSGGVIDGYLKGATVFVDTTNDGEQNASEQAVTTDDNGDFSLNTSSIANGTKIYAFGGIDRSTNAPFKGRLAAVYDTNNSEVILSPLTTYVTALVENGRSLEDAKIVVAKALDINSSDVLSDPMTQPKAFLAAQKVQKAVEVVATAAGGNFENSYGNVFDALAQVTTGSVNDFNATTLVQQVEQEQNVSIDGNVTQFLHTYTHLVDNLSDENISVDNLDTFGNILDSYAKAVQGAIENNESIEAIQQKIEDLNATEVATAVEDDTFTDPVVEATDIVESALDNNVSYLGNNSAADNITQNLILTSPNAAPFDTNDLNLTWSSSNPAVVTTVGVVTRNYLNDVAVELNATVNNALVTNTRVFDLIIKKLEVAPTAEDLNVSLLEDENVTIDLANKIADDNNDTLTITLGSVAHGVASLSGTVLTYVPSSGFYGDDTLTYTVTDSSGLSATGKIDFTIREVGKIVTGGAQAGATALIDSPIAGANVENAKNMFAQLRETAMTFVDTSDNGDTNTSTIVGSQIDTINTKLNPAMETISSDFNDSVSALNTSVEAFTNAIDTDFNTTITTISDRIDALNTQIDDNNYTDDENWSVSANSDTLEHNVTDDGDVVTEVYTFNNQTITIKQYKNDDNGPFYINGAVDVSGSGYDLTVSNMNFSNNHVLFQAHGTLTGDNGASMDLSQLDIESDLNTSIEAINGIQNINVDFNGTITAAGRTLEGLLSTDGIHTILSGVYTGASGEPSLDGKITLNTGLNSLLDAIAIEGSTYVSAWTPILVAQMSNGDKSLVISYQDTGSTSDDNGSVESNIREYNLTTQSGNEIICDVNRSHAYYTNVNNDKIYTDVNNSVTCQDGVTLLPYYTEDGRITAKVNGVTMIIKDAWMDNQNNVQRLKIHFDNDSDTYYDGNGALSLNGEAITVTDVNLTEAPDLFARNFDVEFQGVINDADKKIAATVGITKGLTSKIYAKNIEISDASNVVTLKELSMTLTNKEFLNFTQSQDNYQSRSEFENYYVDYQSRDNNSGDFNFENIQDVTLGGLQVTLLDTDNNALNVDANLSYVNGTDIFANFDGHYDYNGASFDGHIDTNVTATDFSDESVYSGTANVNGFIEANGFAPFNVLTTAIFSGDINSSSVDVYTLFTRDNNYQVALHVLDVIADKNTANITESVTIHLGDTNGVLGSYSITANKGDSVSKGTMHITNKNGDDLATVGEATNGNNWEIQYADGSAETLF
jgi:hypothetical protein